MGKADQAMITGKVRLSYVHLFTAYARVGSTQGPKFSTTLLIPKSDFATKQKIDSCINAAITEGVATKFKGFRPPILGIPIHDGDGVKPSDGMPFGPECKGHWVMTASKPATQPRPEVVDANINPILNQSEVYSGMYARVSLNFFPYDSNGKKGIGCGLGPVQKLEDGEPLAGDISAAAAFGQPQSFAQPAPQYQAPAPGYVAAPVPQPQYQQTPQYQAPVPQQQQYQTAPAPVTINPITGQPMYT